MWPGQQPPGGERNPQDRNPYPQQPGPNPYQQPGHQAPGHQQAPGYQQPGPYQQPNPYPQQPGYQQPGPAQPGYQPYGQQGHPQPHPYQQPTPTPPPGGPAVAWHGQPGPPGPPEPPRGGKKRTRTVAIVVATAVVAAAAVAGAVVLGKDDGGKADTADGPAPSPTTSKPAEPGPGTDPTASQPPSDPDNPRTGGVETDVKPVIPGWQVVVNPKRHNAFDVPPGWTVKGADWSVGFGDDKDKSGLKMLVAMSAPAYFEEDHCTVERDGYKDTKSLAGAGTKGAQGAKSEAEAAKNEALNWALAGYDQSETGDLKLVKSETRAFTSDHGLKGHMAKAVVTGVKKEDKCTTDGKAFAVTFTDHDGDFATWVLHGSTGVEDEVPDATIKKIMSTLRLLEPAS